MHRALPILAVAAAVTLAVGVLDGRGWPSFLIGALLSLSLWVMLLCGSSASDAHRGTEDQRTADPAAYACAAAIGTALGWAATLIGDGNGAFWAVGFILAGAVAPAAVASSRDRR